MRYIQGYIYIYIDTVFTKDNLGFIPIMVILGLTDKHIYIIIYIYIY